METDLQTIIRDMENEVTTHLWLASLGYDMKLNLEAATAKHTLANEYAEYVTPEIPILKIMLI